MACRLTLEVNTYGLSTQNFEKIMVDESIIHSSEIERTDGSKVSRVIRDYELIGLGEELERRWLGVDDDRQSLRDLADYFNRQVLETALNGAGGQLIDGEIENHYRLLTCDDVSASARTQAETRLERLGIDVEALRHDFVSHQAVHTYLTDVREASLCEDEPTDVDVIQSRQEIILRLRNRLVAVTERSLEALRDAGYISLGSFDAMVSVTVYCDDCGSSYDLANLLRRRACDCGEAY